MPSNFAMKEAPSYSSASDASRPLHSNAYLLRLLSSAHTSDRLQSLQQVLYFRRDLSFLDYSHLRRSLESEPSSDLYRPLVKLITKFERQSFKAASAVREQIVGSLPVLDSVEDSISLETAIFTGRLQQLISPCAPSSHTSLRLVVRRLWESYDARSLEYDLLRLAFEEIDRNLSDDCRIKAPCLIVLALSSIYREVRDGEHCRRTRSRNAIDAKEVLMRFFEFAGTSLSEILYFKLSSEALSSLVEFGCWLLGVAFVTSKFEDEFRPTFEELFGMNHNNLHTLETLLTFTIT